MGLLGPLTTQAVFFTLPYPSLQPRLVSKEAPPADKRDAAPAPIVRAVEKYSWADGKKAVT